MKDKFLPNLDKTGQNIFRRCLCNKVLLLAYLKERLTRQAWEKFSHYNNLTLRAKVCVRLMMCQR